MWSLPRLRTRRKATAMSPSGTKAKYLNIRYADAIRWIVLQNSTAFCSCSGLAQLVMSSAGSDGFIDGHAWQIGYAAQGTAVDGGGRQRKLARRRRF
jgi:hypothetical protein